MSQEERQGDDPIKSANHIQSSLPAGCKRRFSMSLSWSCVLSSSSNIIAVYQKPIYLQVFCCLLDIRMSLSISGVQMDCWWMATINGCLEAFSGPVLEEIRLA